MPNFIAKKLKPIKYPFAKDQVGLLWEVKGRNEKLICAQSLGETFFITLKQKSDGNFVVKGDKLSKPARISSLQKALCFYKDNLADDILSEAIQNKSKKEPQKLASVVEGDKILELLDFIKNYDKIFIEIGFGSGRHLLFQAKNNPHALFIGIEVYKPSIEQVSKLASVQNLQNIKLLNTDARLFLSLVGSNIIDRIYLHFPVPWDDSPHRRVVSSEFATECERVLKVGGVFELRSDSKMYVDFTCATFLELRNSKISIQKNVDLEVSSKYEDRWKSQDKDIFDLFYTAKSQSDELVALDDMVFLDIYDTKKVIQSFKNETIKCDDFFVHFEEIYHNENGIVVIRVAFGSFNKPEHSFIKFEDKKCEYFIKKPLLTRTNLQAHEKIKEILVKCKA
ncbi:MULTISPECIES: tRNA (guanosine(46)-N7)-methyltransferase TrmB [unclassified Campylobacter]|uniref:tRNA (guanosine(46)-N7)-methyltransferase TrmB n=1 Tax=unclassified Campylobacter TaxID=2593542 RepID=UPI003D33D77D